jgi:hypothetical protein
LKRACPVIFKKLMLPGLCLLLVIPQKLPAQELEARSLSNVPVGMNFVVIGYGFSKGNTLMDPALPIDDLNAQTHLLAGGYLRTINFFGMCGKVDALLPFSPGDWIYTLAGVEETRTINDIGDPRLRLTVSLKGAPAMRAGEFKNYQQGTVVGAIFQVSLPLGQYDPAELINLGSNRWAFRSEVGVSQGIGKWMVETYAGAWFFTANKKFLGDNKLTQRPLLVAKAHLVRSFPRGKWLALDLGYGFGGRTLVNDEPRDTRISGFRFGAELVAPLGIHHALKLVFASGVRIERGPDFDAVALTYQYRWGGGG